MQDKMCWGEQRPVQSVCMPRPRGSTAPWWDRGRGAGQGSGYCEANIPHVFEPCRRVGWQDVLGEGMSLAYVRRLVRRYGGEITCQSALGVGTTCTFTMAHTLPAWALQD